jgi:hypothetical protein
MIYMGHKVLTSQLNLLPEQTYILNIADFPSGTYLIQYNNNQYQTLIIQH